MINNMTITVAFSNNQVRVWGYDLSFYADTEAFLSNVLDDFSVQEEGKSTRVSTLKNVLYATVTILKEDQSIDSFTLGPEIKSKDYSYIIESHINEVS